MDIDIYICVYIYIYMCIYIYIHICLGLGVVVFFSDTLLCFCPGRSRAPHRLRGNTSNMQLLLETSHH